MGDFGRALKKLIEDVCCGNLWKCESIYDYWAMSLIELNLISCCRLAITMCRTTSPAGSPIHSLLPMTIFCLLRAVPFHISSRRLLANMSPEREPKSMQVYSDSISELKKVVLADLAWRKKMLWRESISGQMRETSLRPASLWIFIGNRETGILLWRLWWIIAMRSWREMGPYRQDTTTTTYGHSLCEYGALCKCRLRNRLFQP